MKPWQRNAVLAAGAIAALAVLVPVWLDLEVYATPKSAPGSWEGTYVDLPSGRTHYVEAGTGPTVLLVAGLTGNTSVWDRSLPVLAQKFHVVAVDMYGRGYSERSDRFDYGPLLYRAQLGELLDALNVDRTAIVGTSMGGAIAIDFVASATDRVWGLVLVDSAGLPFATPAARRLLDVPELGEYVMRLAMPLILSQGFRRGFHDPTKADARFRERYSASAEIAGFRRAVLESLRHFPLHGLQREIGLVAAANIPTLIVWGAEDPIVPLDVYRKLRVLIPKSHGFVIHDARHMPHAERPELFAPNVGRFLATAASRTDL